MGSEPSVMGGQSGAELDEGWDKWLASLDPDAREKALKWSTATAAEHGELMRRKRISRGSRYWNRNRR